MVNYSTILRYSLITLFTCLLFMNTVNAQCSAYFQSVYNSSTDEVEFTQQCTFDTTIHPILFVWDFGDGSTIVDEHPAHHYAAQNNYLVCLVLYVGNGAGCCQDTFCELIDFVPASIEKQPDWISGISLSSYNKNVSLHLTLAQPQSLRMSLVTITGRIFPVNVPTAIPRGRNEIDFTMPDYPAGIYLLRIEDEKGNSVAKRFMVY